MIDCLIIGGGPAGSLCGIRLRQKGVDCVIVDRAVMPRMKLCAGVLTAKSRRVLSEALGADGLKQLLKVSQVSHVSHLRLWHGKNCFVDCDFSDPRLIPVDMRDEDWRFVLVDRTKFDASLIGEYKRLGGRMIEGDGLRSIDFEAQEAVLQSGRRIGYRYLIAADGANSHVEHLLKRYDATFEGKGANSEAFEINVDRSALDIDGINVCFGYVPDTYCWAFDKGDKICIGACRLHGTRYNAKEALGRFVDDLGLRNKDKYRWQGAMIPFDNAMRYPLWHSSVLFCGDAAGLDEAVTGEGIFYALRSGMDAADSIAEDDVGLYLTKNGYLQKLMRKAARYQLLLSHRWLYRIFRAFTAHHNTFVGFYYLTQIDHSSLELLPHIYMRYMLRRRG